MKTDNSLRRTSVWVPLAIALAFAGGLLTGSLNFGDRNNKGNKLSTVLNIIRGQYVEDVNTDSLIEQSIPDLLARLDPHSVYIPAKDLRQTNEELEGSFSGIGISFQILNDTITVVEVISGGPSEHVGLMPGDRIVSINDSVVASVGWNEENVRSALRGPAGTNVKIGIKRNTSATPLTFNITRGDIPMTSIDASYMITPEIGYIKVNRFGTQTYSEFLKALTTLSANHKPNAFIIDLRGNGGGFMEPAILMANEFLVRGMGIVSTRGRLPGQNSQVGADGMGAFSDAQLVVLTDEFSASASEIFAGAVQDNDRGLIVGRRSFGKGLVQNQITLADSSALRLTVARYYTPSGRCIQKSYTPGHLSTYTNEILDRFNRGEFFSADSMQIDKSMIFSTLGGRDVFGGGGIMPDIFVPNDTSGISTWYIKASNAGLLQKFAFRYSDDNRARLSQAKDVDQLLRLIGDDDSLLNEFVAYARSNGIPTRWYYINISRNLIVNQLKALIARDVLGVDAFFRVYNRDDNVINRAVKAINDGEARPPITTTLTRQ